MTKVKAGPSSMGLPWLMSDEKADEGCARVEQTDHRLIFSEVSCWTVSEKSAEAEADEWQIIASGFVRQGYRGMQSLCAGSAESGERLLGFRARSPDRVEGCGSPVETSVRSAEAPTEPEARQRLSRLRAAAIAQLNGVAPFSTGYFLSQEAQECRQLRCRNPFGEAT